MTQATSMAMDSSTLTGILDNGTFHGTGRYSIFNVSEDSTIPSIGGFGPSGPGIEPQPGPGGPPPAAPETVVGLSLLFFQIGVVGLLGNSMVISVILLDRKMRQSVTNLCILNLAVADLLIMLAFVPEIVQFMLNEGWLLGQAMCKTNRFVLVVSLYVSILSLLIVCVERFVAIVYPIKAHILCGRKKILLSIALIWPLAVLCGLPTAMYNIVDRPHPAVPHKFCFTVFPAAHHDTLFKFTEFAMFYMIPVLIQTVLYAIIGRKLYASTAELHTRFQMRPDSSHASESIRARKSVVKMLVASVLVYTICYAPPQILLFYNTFYAEPFHMTWGLRVFSYIIAYVNSAANPILYGIFSQNFRRNFQKCLCHFCLQRPGDYQKAPFDSSFDSRGTSRRVSSTRATTISRV